MKFTQGLVARVRQISPDRRDILLAAALVAGSAVELGTQLNQSPHPAITMAALLTMCAGVSIRRRQPILLAAGACVCVLLFERFGEVPDWMLPSLAVLIYMYTVGAHVPGRPGLWAAAALAAMTFAVVALDPRTASGLVGMLGNVVMYSVAPFAVGRALASRRALTRELRIKAQDLEREREERARQAAADERIRIARELHDVIAHSVSVMVIQTQAAHRVASTDRERARAALQAVEAAGRDALAEMRRMVGVLHRGDTALCTALAPGLGQVASLANRARAAGLAVELHVEGEPPPLPPGLDLAAYRVIQEALTNVVKHAGPARACVTVAYGADELELEISDDGRGPGARPAADGSGHGLIGMRERLGLYGGELTAEPGERGGFVVRARIPLVAVPA